MLGGPDGVGRGYALAASDAATGIADAAARAVLANKTSRLLGIWRSRGSSPI